jgi:multidrug efflux system outer membrane protein
MRRLVLILLAGASLGGCTLDPAYRRPAAPVPSAFPQGPSYAAPASGPAAASIAWRSVFLDPDLRR